jgi:hypothetical protein
MSASSGRHKLISAGGRMRPVAIHAGTSSGGVERSHQGARSAASGQGARRSESGVAYRGGIAAGSKTSTVMTGIRRSKGTAQHKQRAAVPRAAAEDVCRRPGRFTCPGAIAPCRWWVSPGLSGQRDGRVPLRGCPLRRRGPGGRDSEIQNRSERARPPTPRVARCGRSRPGSSGLILRMGFCSQRSAAGVGK